MQRASVTCEASCAAAARRKVEELHSVIEELRRIRGDEIPSAAAAILTRPANWSRMAVAYIRSLDEATFVENVLREHVAGVEPHTFLLYDEPKRFQIVLHHFDRGAFDRHVDEGRVT